MTLSGHTLRAALAAVGAVGRQIRSFDELAAGADTAMRQAPPGLTVAGAAAFLATAAVESAWFRTTTEFGSGQRYAPYVGRTFVQLTWRANYAGFGRWCHAKGLVGDPAVFANAPASLSDFRWAWLGAVYYFETHGIWRWANAGNFLAVSQAVNGGNGRVGTRFVPNGWVDRTTMYRVFLGAGGDLLPAGSAPPPPHDRIDDDMALRDYDIIGTGTMRTIVTVGSSSSLVAQAWISLIACGPGGASVRVFAQSDAGGLADRMLVAEFRDGHSTRQWWELPDGTVQVNLQYDAPDGAVIAIESRPK